MYSSLPWLLRLIIVLSDKNCLELKLLFYHVNILLIDKNCF